MRLKPRYCYREFCVWRGMRQRCLHPSAPDYHRYGSRGVKICERWVGKLGFWDFCWDMAPMPEDAHSIELIDEGGLYEPGNCRWVTRTEVARKRRTNRIIEFMGARSH